MSTFLPFLEKSLLFAGAGPHCTTASFYFLINSDNFFLLLSVLLHYNMWPYVMILWIHSICSTSVFFFFLYWYILIITKIICCCTRKNQPLIRYGRPRGDGEVRMVSNFDRRKLDRFAERTFCLHLNTPADRIAAAWFTDTYSCLTWPPWSANDAATTTRWRTCSTSTSSRSPTTPCRTRRARRWSRSPFITQYLMTCAISSSQEKWSFSWKTTPCHAIVSPLSPNPSSPSNTQCSNPDQKKSKSATNTARRMAAALIASDERVRWSEAAHSNMSFAAK